MCQFQPFLENHMFKFNYSITKPATICLISATQGNWKVKLSVLDAIECNKNCNFTIVICESAYSNMATLYK